MEKRESVRKVEPYLENGDSNLKRGLGKKSGILKETQGLAKKSGTQCGKDGL